MRLWVCDNHCITMRCSSERVSVCIDWDHTPDTRDDALLLRTDRRCSRVPVLMLSSVLLFNIFHLEKQPVLFTHAEGQLTVWVCRKCLWVIKDEQKRFFWINVAQVTCDLFLYARPVKLNVVHTLIKAVNLQKCAQKMKCSNHGIRTESWNPII